MNIKEIQAKTLVRIIDDDEDLRESAEMMLSACRLEGFDVFRCRFILNTRLAFSSRLRRRRHKNAGHEWPRIAN